MSDGPRYFTISEVAERCGLSARLVRQAIKAGDLAACRVNARVIRVPEAAMVRWMERHRVRVPRVERGAA